MDIKISQATQATGQTAQAAAEQSFLSYLNVRTMKQDLAAQTAKTPAAAVKAMPPAPPWPKVPAAAKKKQEVVKEKLARLQVGEFKDKLTVSYESAKLLVAAKKFDEAIVKLRQIMADVQAGWWLKWQASRLLKKAQKLLITPVAKKEGEKGIPAVSGISPLPRPVISPLVGQVAPAAPAAPVFQPPKVAVPPPSLPVGKPIPVPEVEEKIIPPVFPPSPPQPTPPVIPSVTPPLPIPKPAAAAAPASRPVRPMAAATIMPELLASLEKPAAPAEKGLNWKKFILIGGILALVFFSVGLWLIFRRQPAPLPSASPTASVSLTPSPSPPTPTPVSALFEMDKQLTIQLAAAETNLAADKLQQQFGQSNEPAGSFSQVSFQINNNQLSDFSELTAFLKLDFFGLATQKCGPEERCFNSPTLQDYLKTDQFSFFVYFQASVSSSPFSGGQNEGRPGLVVALKDAQVLATTSQTLKDLESMMPGTLQSLLLAKKAEMPATPKFSDNTYQGVTIRYLNLPDATLSFDYAIVENTLLIATSKESMYAAIDRLREKNKTTFGYKTEGQTELKSSEAIVDCGEAGPDKSALDNNKVVNCLETNFKACKPAKYTPSIDMGSLGGLMTYYYEIIGPVNNLCAVKSKFLKNPNPVWVGKEMTCQYDNTKDFETAIKDMSKCSGPLYDLMGQPKSAL